jgi:hypothetical protein
MNIFLKVGLILFGIIVVMSLVKVILDRYFKEPNGDDPKER